MGLSTHTLMKKSSLFCTKKLENRLMTYMEGFGFNFYVDTPMTQLK